MTEYLRYPNYATNPVDGSEILDGTIENVDLNAGVGGIYKGSGTVPTTVIATITDSLTFASGSSGALLRLSQADASSDSFDFNFRKARGTIASPTVITTADELGVINFTGYGGAAGYITGAAIKAISSGTIADSRVPGFMSFWTGTNAAPSVLTERMRIDNAGSIGIGLTAPVYKLDVFGMSTTGGINSNMGMNLTRVPTAPATMTRTVVAGAGLSIGTYWYRVVFYNAIGNATPSAAMDATTTAGNQQVNLSTIPISSDASVVGRKIYRSRVTDTSSYGGLLVTIADNTTTTYTDTTPDASILPATQAARAIFANANLSSNYISVDGIRSMVIDMSLTTFGYNAGAAITVAPQTTIYGASAGQAITYGGSNSLFGYGAGAKITTGADNTVVGSNSLVNATGGGKNIAIGPNVLYNVVSGEHNIALGYYTANAVTGTGNVYMGSYTAFSNTTGNYNIGIGFTANPLSTTGSNQLNIGNLIYGTGTHSATSRKVFTRAGSSQSGNMWEWQNNAGTALTVIDASGFIGQGVATPLSSFDSTGSIGLNVVTLSADTTLDNTHYLVNVDASGGNKTITLPAAAGVTRRIYIIKKSDSSGNTVTIDANGAETIDGATTKVVNTQFAGYTIQCNGTSWMITSSVS
jgi:hypothetical protein